MNLRLRIISILLRILCAFYNYNNDDVKRPAIVRLVLFIFYFLRLVLRRLLSPLKEFCSPDVLTPADLLWL